ncbi:hypothetical protein PEC106568_34860 [Pectobacterium carotovorum subsp. carotovorum]|nr:hypothetical protein PEC106568_34860 [Pectobacterium carotovorum subsp. carotovorum]
MVMHRSTLNRQYKSILIRTTITKALSRSYVFPRTHPSIKFSCSDHKTQSGLSVANPESKHLNQLKFFKHQQHIWGEGAFSFEKRLMTFAPESQAFVAFAFFRCHLSGHIAVAHQR